MQVAKTKRQLRLQMPTHRIICGNTLEVLKEMESESVDCVVTSPPYWGLRFYGDETKTIWGGDPDCKHEWEERIGERIDVTGFQRNRRGLNKMAEKLDGNPRFAGSKIPPVKKESQFCKKCGAWYGQLGLEPTLDMYLDHLLQITAELKRVLKKTGTLFWNHGDNYSGSGIGTNDYRTPESRSINKTSIMHPKKPVAQKCEITAKSLCLQNFRLIQRMIDEQGWILRNIIIWHKPNCMPSSAKDRFTVDFEPVFFLTKSKKYYFEQQFEPWQDTNPQDTKRTGKYISYKGKWAEDRSNRAKVVGSPLLGRNKRCVWKIPTQPFKEAHFAVFPEALAKNCILAGCPKEVCAKCGKAREKIYRETGELIGMGGYGSKTAEHIGCSPTSSLITKKVKEKEEAGYTDCGCGAGFKLGIVLDPFAGSGTVGVIAEKLGRDSIQIDIKPAYCQMAYQRLKSLVEQTKLPGEKSEIERVGFT